MCSRSRAVDDFGQMDFAVRRGCARAAASRRAPRSTRARWRAPRRGRPARAPASARARSFSIEASRRSPTTSRHADDQKRQRRERRERGAERAEPGRARVEVLDQRASSRGRRRAGRARQAPTRTTCPTESGASRAAAARPAPAGRNSPAPARRAPCRVPRALVVVRPRRRADRRDGMPRVCAAHARRSPSRNCSARSRRMWGRAGRSTAVPARAAAGGSAGNGSRSRRASRSGP